MIGYKYVYTRSFLVASKTSRRKFYVSRLKVAQTTRKNTSRINSHAVDQDIVAVPHKKITPRRYALERKRSGKYAAKITQEQVRIPSAVHTAARNLILGGIHLQVKTAVANTLHHPSPIWR